MSIRIRRPLAALLGTVSLAGVLTTVGGAPAARSVPPPADAQCPATYPLGDLTAGQPVDGLTVTTGTTPGTFTGTVLGRIADGIAPGLDMVVARLSSPEIDRVGGIWEGMSGSPVYAADGRLIGAVSYGLAAGASPVAGITPADDMRKLLTTAPALRPAARKVALPARVQARVVDSGAATGREASGGLERLTVPVGVSGLSSARLRRAEGRLHLGDVRLYRSAPAAAAPAAPAAVPMAAGGNLAASLSYGDFSAVGVGTTTLVCDGTVVGFGHPFDFTGDTTLTMHGASAVYVQEDPLGAPFKVANPTGPVGVVDEDRMAGIKGEIGRAPATTLVRTVVSGPGGRHRVGDTRVSVPDFTSTATALGFLANLDRVFDHTGKGSAYVHLTVTGRTTAGTPFTLTRTNRYTSRDDISYESSYEPASIVDELMGNDLTGVTLGQVRVDAALTDQVREFRVAKVRVKVRGHWRTVGTDSVVRIRRGRILPVRVVLASRRNEAGTVVVSTRVRVPASAPRHVSGVVSIGAAAFQDDGEEGTDTSGDGAGPATFGALLRGIQDAPRNDELAVTLQLDSDGDTPSVATRVQAGAVVTGGTQFGLRVR